MELWADFLTNNQRLIHKCTHYFPAYERHLARFRDRPVTMIEIGCGQGGSLQMWKRYLGPLAQIVGIDIRPECEAFEEDQIAVCIGSQSDPVFLNSVVERFGQPDIVLDDGSHHMGDMSASFRILYSQLQSNGVYMVEDMHTCYWPDYEGGHQRPGTFIEICKDLFDELNAEETLGGVAPTAFTRATLSMHLYKGIAVFERGRAMPRNALKIGQRDEETRLNKRERKRALAKTTAKELDALNTLLAETDIAALYRRILPPDTILPPDGYDKYINFRKVMQRATARAQHFRLHESPPLNVLDLSSGPGFFCYVCSLYGHTVAALDSPNAIDAARRQWLPLPMSYRPVLELFRVPFSVQEILPQRAIEMDAAFCDSNGKPMGFDFIGAARVKFNVAKQESDEPSPYWGAEDYLFFLSDLRERFLRPGGRLCLGFARDLYSDPQSEHSAPLIAYHQALGALLKPFVISNDSQFGVELDLFRPEAWKAAAMIQLPPLIREQPEPITDPR